MKRWLVFVLVLLSLSSPIPQRVYAANPIGYVYYFPIVAGGTRMLNVGPNSPGTVADDAAVGYLAWGNPDNAKIEDGSFASAGVVTVFPLQPYYSHYLKSTNFGFAVPTSATIAGVLVRVKGKYFNSFDDQIYSLKLVKGGVVAGNEKAGPTSLTTTNTFYGFGSSSDMHGLALSPSDVNASNFGVVLECYGHTSFSGFLDWEIDFVEITVYYTMPATSRGYLVAP